MRVAFLVPAFATLIPSTPVAQTPATPLTPIGRYEVVECFQQIQRWAVEAGIECGWLTLPEVPSRLDGPTVRLAVARLRVRNPTEPPIVFLHGGPGGVGAILTSSLTGYTTLSAGVRDVILFDQRAVGLSEPKLCVGIPGDSDVRDTTQLQARWNESARACIADMKAKGRDRAGYTTAVQADDVRELRLALGYRQWDVFGVSYGGRLAMELMQHDPTGVRAVVLNSPAIPSVASMTEDPISVQTALTRLFARCAKQDACRTKFPTVEQDFYTVYDSLSANPLTISTMGGPTRFDGHAFLRAIRCQLSNGRKALRVPLAINELRRGDRAATATVLTNDCASSPGLLSQVNVKNSLILCADGNGASYWEARRAVQQRVKPMWLEFEEGGEECDIWQPRYADSADLSPLKSDIPTLVITGELDERTPTDHARRGTASLSRKYLFEIPGDGHGTPPVGCQTELIQQFLRDPMRQPDSSCIAAMPEVKFATESLSIANLTFVIVADATSARFGGSWGVEYPNVPRPFMVDLRVEGRRVTGTWNPNRLAIVDGSVSGDTLRFSVKSPDGARTVRFTAILSGDSLSFVRDVDPPGSGQGIGIFGALGARTFTARRSP